MMNEVSITVALFGFAAIIVVWLAKWRSELDARFDDLHKLAQDTHTLVNSNMGVQLKLGMELSEFKATTTGLLADIQAATLARHRLEEHNKKQEIVDSGVLSGLAV